MERIRLILFIIFSVSQLMLMDHRSNEMLFLLTECRRQKQYYVWAVTVADTQFPHRDIFDINNQRCSRTPCTIKWVNGWARLRVWPWQIILQGLEYLCQTALLQNRDFTSTQINWNNTNSTNNAHLLSCNKMWVVGFAECELYSDIYEVISAVSIYLGPSIWQLQSVLFPDEIRWVFTVITLCA